MKYVLSYGGGVNSTALLLLLTDKKKPLDAVIFADTGSELPDTYKYIDEVTKPLCVKYNINFFVVKNFTHGKTWDSLYEYCWHHRLIPSRMIRWCTKEFKIEAIRRFYEAQGWDKEGIVEYHGIDYGEVHRMKQSDVDYITIEYPLIDAKMDRDACKNYIIRHGLPIPTKSGCYFCPFQNIHRWLELKSKYPDLFKKAVELERNNSGYPNFLFLYSKKPLSTLDKYMTLDDFIETGMDMCDNAYCMT